MHPAVLTLFGVAAQPGQSGVVLAGPGALNPLASLARAQVSTSVTAPGADGLTWAEFAANAPRFAGTAQRLLVEGQRGNLLRNPRREGAALGVIGAGGALPTNWSFLSGQVGLQVEILALGSVDGVQTVTLRFTGTATGTSIQMSFEPITQVVATPSSIWSASVFQRQEAAPAPPSSHRLQILNRNSGGTLLAGSPGAASFTPGAALQRTVLTGTLSSDVNVARVNAQYSALLTSGQAYDWTITLGWPQLEQAGFASTPVLPPAGAPAASTRGADLVTAPLVGLGIGGAGASTLLWSGVLAQAAPAGVAQAILALDDGTANNRFALVNAAGGASLVAERALAGAVASAALGTHTPGAALRLGMAVDGAGRLAVSLNGGAAVVVTGGPAAGLTTLRLGNLATGAAAMFGETALLRVLPQALSDANLAGAVAALP